jgi:hypothetical protein
MVTYEGLRGKTIIVNIPKMFSIEILKFQNSKTQEIKNEIFQKYLL